MAANIFCKQQNSEQGFQNAIITGGRAMFSPVWSWDQDTKFKMAIAQLTKTKIGAFWESHIKIILITFFDSKGIIHKELIPQERTFDIEYYLQVMKRLLTRPDLEHSLHEYSHRDQRFWPRKGLQCCHPSYSPDLAPEGLVFCLSGWNLYWNVADLIRRTWRPNWKPSEKTRLLSLSKVYMDTVISVFSVPRETALR